MSLMDDHFIYKKYRFSQNGCISCHASPLVVVTGSYKKNISFSCL